MTSSKLSGNLEQMKYSAEEKMDSNKKNAKIVGVLFIIGTAAGLLSLIVTPILAAPDYLIKLSENKSSVIWGVLSVLTMGISLSMMSVILFPILRKHNEILALGAVIFRGALELASYLGVAISWLLLLTLSKEYVNAGAPAALGYQLTGTLLRDAGLQIGSIGAIVFSIGALIIYYAFYKTKLIPTWLSLWGFIGAILYLASPILIMFNLDFEFLQYILGVQEMVMAGWLIIKGFNASAFNSLMINSK